VIGFAISVALIHWVARFLGGQGTFDKISYAMAAITAPLTLISAFLIPVNAIPYASFCTIPILLLLSLYALYLELTAVKSVHRFGWLESAIAVFLPVMLIVFLCGFMVVGVMRTLGPSINDIFQQMQQAL
jgi:Yip1 domain